jgi:hypothetical protein
MKAVKTISTMTAMTTALWKYPNWTIFTVHRKYKRKSAPTLWKRKAT